MSDLPSELSDSDATRVFETRLLRWCTWFLPLLILGTCVLIGRYPKTILFLQQAESWRTMLAPKIMLISVVLPVSAMVCWWLSIRFEHATNRPLANVVSITLVVLSLLVSGVLLGHPRIAFTLREAVKARAVQANFVRNMAFQQELLETQRNVPSEATRRIVLVGSSQINLGIDPDTLGEACAADLVVSACMPGMVPTQYFAVSERLAQQQPTHVVCWLSEFDFFREDTLPIVRMRWVSDRDNVRQLLRSMTAREKVRHRGELADLALAAALPTWRLRSMFQMVAFRFWWAWDDDVLELDEDEKRIGGRLVDRKAGVANARQNIKRTSLVELNFRAFEGFARRVTRGGAKLIVLEGESHPDTMAAYPAEFRAETRERLTALAESIGFDYVTERALPDFKESDWRDAVHLNEKGRDRLTQFVAARLASDETLSPIE